MKYEYWFRSINIVEPIRALIMDLSSKLINFSIEKDWKRVHVEVFFFNELYKIN
jgi:hypothetical protein